MFTVYEILYFQILKRFYIKKCQLHTGLIPYLIHWTPLSTDTNGTQLSVLSRCPFEAGLGRGRGTFLAPIQK